MDKIISARKERPTKLCVTVYALHKLSAMYTTKLVNKNVMADPAYITIGDPYKDRKENPFRESKKEDKPTAPFQTKVF